MHICLFCQNNLSFHSQYVDGTDKHACLQCKTDYYINTSDNTINCVELTYDAYVIIYDMYHQNMMVMRGLSKMIFEKEFDLPFIPILTPTNVAQKLSLLLTFS